MATKLYRELSAEERLVWFGIAMTYPVYFMGGLYVTGSALGWLMLMIIGLRFLVEGKPENGSAPLLVWFWIFAMLVMLVALFIGHSNWELGTGKTIKSSIGWAKGWALIAVFILVGSLAPIRPQLLVRAVCVLSLHTFIFGIITFCASKLRIPGEIFVSPLQIVGGPGPNFFTVSLYGLNPETGGARWQFFGPWAPAAGLLACLYLVISMQEKDRFWRSWGIAGSAVMCLLSQSRAGWVIFVMLWPLLMFSDKLKDPRMLVFLGIIIPIILILGQPLFEWVMDSYQQIKESRPASTRVRAALANIALQRWESEAFWFGHGIVERGPKLVEGMPIGSHHSWYGLLFVKGLVGLLALAVPLFLTSVYLLWQSQTSKLAHTALCLTAVMICYSFFENLEILSYLFWPALLLIGMALNPLKAGENYVEEI